MKVVILGVTGGAGLEIVRQTIARGHSVTAFIRSPERLKPFQEQIKTKQGNLLISSELPRLRDSYRDWVLSGSTRSE